MEPYEPSLQLVSVMKSISQYRIMFINGSTLNPKDLERAKASQAKCVFVLVDKHAPNPSSADSATILRAVSIKRHIEETCDPGGPPFQCILQVCVCVGVCMCVHVLISCNSCANRFLTVLSWAFTSQLLVSHLNPKP